MAGPSISNIAVTVTANASSLTQTMNQAATSVGNFQRKSQAAMKGVATGIGQTGQVAQQAVFAVDDFFAAFATGGLAGGLRGAGNNLTMIASMLGGIKLQLGLIAVLSVGQLLAKQFGKGSDEAERLSKSAEKAAASVKRFLDQRSKISDVFTAHFGQRRDIGRDFGANRSDIKKLTEHGETLFDKQRGAQMELDDIASERASQGALKAAAEKTLKQRRSLIGSRAYNAESEIEAGIYATAQKTVENYKKIAEELDDREKSARANLEIAKQEIELQPELLEALKQRVKLNEEIERRQQHLANAQAFKGFQPFVNAKERRATQLELEELNVEIEGMRESIRSRRGQYISSMFGNMPQANQLGSVGAISAINTATAGSMNARDSLTRNTEEMKRDMRRLRELEEKKKELAIEVIGIP